MRQSNFQFYSRLAGFGLKVARALNRLSIL